MEQIAVSAGNFVARKMNFIRRRQNVVASAVMSMTASIVCASIPSKGVTDISLPSMRMGAAL